MKILIIGFLLFSGWSAFSTYIYVCKIRGLCYEPETLQINSFSHKDVIAKDTLRMTAVQEKLAIPENLMVYFAFDKSEFVYNAESDKYFDESNLYLGQNSQARLSITGYTDAIGTNEYNQALGFRRAQSAQRYFESKGILANKIIIESRGESDPADVNSTTAGRANNRRTSITIKK